MDGPVRLPMFAPAAELTPLQVTGGAHQRDKDFEKCPEEDNQTHSIQDPFLDLGDDFIADFMVRNMSPPCARRCCLRPHR